MTKQRYYRPAQTNRIEYAVSNSRFISTAGPIFSVEQAKAFKKRIRDEMSDASHHVYAFRIGHGNSVIDGMSDDGEPSGTAGPPTMAVLRGSDIGDVIIVTTRYFGGTKLGTGGLVRAYSESARLVLDELQIEENIPKNLVGLDIPYSTYESIKRLIAEFDGAIEDEIFRAEVTILATFPTEQIALFNQQLQDITSGQAEIIILD